MGFEVCSVSSGVCLTAALEYSHPYFSFYFLIGRVHLEGAISLAPCSVRVSVWMLLFIRWGASYLLGPFIAK